VKHFSLPLALVAVLASAGLAQTTATGPTSAPAARGRGPTGQVVVTADHPDWNYVPGDPVKFTVTAPAGTAITYTIGLEMMKLISQTATIPGSGTLVLDGGTLKEPGFLRCTVTAQGAGRGLATAAFSPEKIKPTQTEPADFDAFWAKAKAELATLPIDAQLTPLPQYSTPTVEVSQVSLQNIGTPPAATSRFYGILCVPRGEGPFPAMMVPPGAGVRGPSTETTWANRGFITLYVGIHEMPAVQLPNAPAAPAVANDYHLIGLDNPDHYYFRRVFMGCLRANDYLVSLPKWDHKTLVGLGGSQGGYLTLVTAALDSRETCLVASFPAYCDVTGYVHGRAGGWPKLLFDDLQDPDREKKIATTAYFDTVNFAKRLQIPGHYGWGYNDETCPPDSTFSAYNVISAPKELTIVKEMGHPRVPELTTAETNWLLKQVGKAP
jgi:cephalosporin-C deacetylase